MAIVRAFAVAACPWMRSGSRVVAPEASLAAPVQDEHERGAARLPDTRLRARSGLALSNQQEISVVLLSCMTVKHATSVIRMTVASRKPAEMLNSAAAVVQEALFRRNSVPRNSRAVKTAR
jgi:hypothetical protein